jgi:hypothetical protein
MWHGWPGPHKTPSRLVVVSLYWADPSMELTIRRPLVDRARTLLISFGKGRQVRVCIQEPLPRLAGKQRQASTTARVGN